MYMKRACFADVSRKLSMDCFFKHVLIKDALCICNNLLGNSSLFVTRPEYKLSPYFLNLNNFKMITALTLTISALSTVSMYHSFIMVKYLYEQYKQFYLHAKYLYSLVLFLQTIYLFPRFIKLITTSVECLSGGGKKSPLTTLYFIVIL